MSSLHQASALMYLTGRAASPASAYVKNTAPALCYLCSLCSYVFRAKRHKGKQPLSLINKKAIAKKRYGVALMFLRAHGRKSMPVSLEALMFLCPYVFALATNLKTHGTRRFH